jgi:hydrogenase-4 component F
MILLALILVPAISGGIAFAVTSKSVRRAILIVCALVHAGLTSSLWFRRPGGVLNEWLQVDSLGLLFLSIVSGLFLASAIYSIAYLREEEAARHVDREEGFLFSNEPEAVFVGCLLLFLASMTLVTLSHHLGLLWVGIEGTTLASAPLIYFHRHHRSLEATWKYILICSVGIALALMGNFVLSVATTSADGRHEIPLIVNRLLANAGTIRVDWLKAAFLFFLVGYGTKMGLAPLHTWLPDAHSEAPSPVSALLSGALLNCAFLGILRVHQLCVAAGEADFSGPLLIFFGLMSLTVAAVFIMRQTDMKRMLAYSSVEHMGVQAIGVGLGGAGVFGAMLHCVNHSAIKAALFLTAGNILAYFGRKRVHEISGMAYVIPVSAVLWVAGFLAITGTPPFGAFLSEFTILKAALDGEHNIVAVFYLVMLALIFVGMANIFLHMAQGKPPEAAGPGVRETPLALLPPAMLLSCALLLGIYVPRPLDGICRDVQSSFEPPRVSTASAPLDAVTNTLTAIPAPDAHPRKEIRTSPWR